MTAGRAGGRMSEEIALQRLLADAAKAAEAQVARVSLLLGAVGRSQDDAGVLLEWAGAIVDDMDSLAERLAGDTSPGYRHLVGELVRLYDGSCRDVERLCAPDDRSAVARKVFMLWCGLSGLAVACLLYCQVLQQDPTICRDLARASDTTARLQHAIRNHLAQLKDKVLELEHLLLCRREEMSQVRDTVRGLASEARKMRRSLAAKGGVLPRLDDDDEGGHRQALLREVLRERKVVGELESQLCRRCPLQVRKIHPPV